MLYLLFQIGNERYVIQAAQVAAILPVVRAKEMPLAIDGVAGVIDYHGTPIPLIDLSLILLKRASRARMSTRIMLVHYSDSCGQPRLLGLVAENVTRTLRRLEEDFVEPGVDAPSARYLGRVLTDPEGIIQHVEISELLPAEVQEQLFRQIEA